MLNAESFEMGTTSELFNLIALCGWMVLSGFFSGMETGIYCLDRVKLRFNAMKNVRTALIIQKLLENPRSLLATVLVGTNIANYFAAAVGTRITQWWLGPSGPILPALLTTLALSPLMMVFCEMFPKVLFQKRSYPLVNQGIRALTMFRAIFRPVTLALSLIVQAISVLLGRSLTEINPYLSRKLLKYHFDQTSAKGVLLSEQRMMLSNLIEMKETRLKAVMTPLKNVMWIHESASIEEVVEKFRRSGFARLPVRKSDGSIAGVINVLDLYYSEKPLEKVTEIMRPVPELNTDMTLDVALLKLQPLEQPMAIVKDSRGQIAGIVTLGDIIKEIIEQT